MQNPQSQPQMQTQLHMQQLQLQAQQQIQPQIPPTNTQPSTTYSPNPNTNTPGAVVAPVTPDDYENLTPVQARTQPQFRQWFAQMESHGYSTEQINSHFMQQIALQKEQRRKMREQESVLISQQLAEQQQQRDVMQRRMNDQFRQQQQMRIAQQQQVIQHQQQQQQQVHGNTNVSQSNVNQTHVQHQQISQQMNDNMNVLQEHQRKVQMAENIVSAYGGRVQMEQLLRMPYAQIENLHKEIMSRLREQGFSVQQQQQIQLHQQSQQRAQAQQQQNVQQTQRMPRATTNNTSSSPSTIFQRSSIVNNFIPSFTQNSTSAVTSNPTSTATNAPLTSNQQSPQTISNGTNHQQPSTSSQLPIPSTSNPKILALENHPIEIVLVLLHQYPQIKDWLSKMHYHGTVTTSDSHAIQFLNSLMDSQPQFTNLIDTIQIQLQSKREHNPEQTVPMRCAEIAASNAQQQVMQNGGQGQQISQQQMEMEMKQMLAKDGNTTLVGAASVENNTEKKMNGIQNLPSISPIRKKSRKRKSKKSSISQISTNNKNAIAAVVAASSTIHSGRKKKDTKKKKKKKHHHHHSSGTSAVSSNVPSSTKKTKSKSHKTRKNENRKRKSSGHSKSRRKSKNRRYETESSSTSKEEDDTMGGDDDSYQPPTVTHSKKKRRRSKPKKKKVKPPSESEYDYEGMTSDAEDNDTYNPPGKPFISKTDDDYTPAGADSFCVALLPSRKSNRSKKRTIREVYAGGVAHIHRRNKKPKLMHNVPVQKSGSKYEQLLSPAPSEWRIVSTDIAKDSLVIKLKQIRNPINEALNKIGGQNFKLRAFMKVLSDVVGHPLDTKMPARRRLVEELLVIPGVTFAYEYLEKCRIDAYAALQNASEGTEFNASDFITNYFRDPINDGSEDFCFICRCRGDVICCDSCPHVFHPRCLGFHNIPNGDWFCNECLDKQNIIKYDGKQEIGDIDIKMNEIEDELQIDEQADEVANEIQIEDISNKMEIDDDLNKIEMNVKSNEMMPSPNAPFSENEDIPDIDLDHKIGEMQAIEGEHVQVEEHVEVQENVPKIHEDVQMEVHVQIEERVQMPEHVQKQEEVPIEEHVSMEEHAQIEEYPQIEEHVQMEDEKIDEVQAVEEQIEEYVQMEDEQPFEMPEPDSDEINIDHKPMDEQNTDIIIEECVVNENTDENQNIGNLVIDNTVDEEIVVDNDENVIGGEMEDERDDGNMDKKDIIVDDVCNENEQKNDGNENETEIEIDDKNDEIGNENEIEKKENDENEEIKVQTIVEEILLPIVNENENQSEVQMEDKIDNAEI